MEKLRRLREICRRRNVALAYLFGSQKDTAYQILLGEAGEPGRPAMKAALNDPLADIDLGLVFNPPLAGLSGFNHIPGLNSSLTQGRSPNPRPPLRILYAELYNELLELFEPYPLDLVFLEEGHSVFQLEAIKGICVYEASPTFRADYEMTILRKAADFSYVLQAFAREALEEF